MSGDVQVSVYPGMIIVSEPKDVVQPRLIVDKYVSRRITIGEDIVLPCAAQGHPVPTYVWKRELHGQIVPIVMGNRIVMVTDGLLKIFKVRFGYISLT